MKYEYKTVSLMTVKGIEQAEKLKAAGWKVILHTPFSIQFERPITPIR